MSSNSESEEQEILNFFSGLVHESDAQVAQEKSKIKVSKNRFEPETSLKNQDSSSDTVSLTEDDALSQLTNILVRPETQEFKGKIDSIQTELVVLDRKVSESEELIKALLPEVSNELNRKLQDANVLLQNLDHHLTTEIRDDFSRLNQDILEVKNDLSVFKERVATPAGLPLDFVPQMKEDFTEIKNDLARLNQDVLEIKNDFSLFKERGAMRSEFPLDFVQQMKKEITEIRDNFSRLNQDILEMKHDFTCLKEKASAPLGLPLELRQMGQTNAGVNEDKPDFRIFDEYFSNKENILLEKIMMMEEKMSQLEVDILGSICEQQNMTQSIVKATVLVAIDQISDLIDKKLNRFKREIGSFSQGDDDDDDDFEPSFSIRLTRPEK